MRGARAAKWRVKAEQKCKRAVSRRVGERARGRAGGRTRELASVWRWPQQRRRRHQLARRALSFVTREIGEKEGGESRRCARASSRNGGGGGGGDK